MTDIPDPCYAELKRYKLDAGPGYDDGWELVVDECEWGDWVKYEDAEKITDALRERIYNLGTDY